VLNVPTDVTVECDESSEPSHTGEASATDNCDASPTITYADESSGACPVLITRTWTATDACGNSASADQIIAVDDTTAPVLSVPDDVTIECGESTDPSNTGAATATDNCDALPTISYADTPSGECPLLITRTWTAVDHCGNSTSLDQLITVQDTTAPVIACPEDTTVPCGSTADPTETGMATATDNCDPSPSVTYSDSSSGECPTLITRTWTATDTCGNSSMCVQLIHGVCAVSVSKEGCLVHTDCHGKVIRMTLEYTGEGCGASHHHQPGSVTCTGDAAMAEPVRILVTSGNGQRIYADVSGVMVGDAVVADAANAGSNHLHSVTWVRIYEAGGTLIEEIMFHTSCSEPLAVGDQFGSMLLLAMTTTEGGEVTEETCITSLPAGGGDVEYTYVITNESAVTVTDVIVMDDVLGEVPGSPIASIGPGESVTLYWTVFVAEPTTNTVSVLAHVGDVECTDTASTTIGCRALAVRSYRDHGTAGELYIDMGTHGGIEPRLGGIQHLEVDLVDASSFGGVANVACVNAGDVSTYVDTTSLVGSTVAVTFSPALPDQDACIVSLDCGASVCARSCEGDLNQSGSTTTADSLQVKIRFGYPVDNSNAMWDFNVTGSITTADSLLIKIRFGFAAPECP
jgi:hypothetical protein